MEGRIPGTQIHSEASVRGESSREKKRHQIYCINLMVHESGPDFYHEHELVGVVNRYCRMAFQMQCPFGYGSTLVILLPILESMVDGQRK